jgi:hypothetical protein
VIAVIAVIGKPDLVDRTEEMVGKVGLAGSG